MRNKEIENLPICLLAAAPAMLEALEEICAQAESWHTTHDHATHAYRCDALCELIPKMKSAIRLAKGESR